MRAPPPPTRALPWRLFENVALVLTLIALGLFRGDLETLSLVAASRVTTAIALGTAIIVVRGGPRGMWSPSAVFFIILVMFHVGLVAAYGLGRAPDPTLEESAQLWLYRRSTIIALWVTDLGLVGYAIGVRLTQLRPRSTRSSDRSEASLDQVVGATGAIFVILSVVAWFGIALAKGGPGLLVAPYREFLDATRGTLMPVTDRLAYYGLPFIAASTRRSQLGRIALFAFVVRALFEFPIGLRAEVLFPSFAALTVLAVRRIPMKGSRALLWAIGLLAAIAMIRDLRQVGVRGVSLSALGANPLDGMAEMGSSLRPVSEVVFWHELGDPFADGETYWAPIDRSLIYYIVPGWTRLPVGDDPRVMNNVVMERSGPIGFSIVAEAYRNFAAGGVLVVLLLVGLLLGRVDTWSDGRVSQCAVGVIMTGLLLHVRNTFVPLPAHFVMGFLAIGLMVMISRARAERMRPIPTPRS